MWKFSLFKKRTIFLLKYLVGQNFRKYKCAGYVRYFSVSTAMPPWMDAWWHNGQDNPCMNDLSPFAIYIYRRKQLYHQKLKHWDNNGHWNDQSYAMISFYFFFNPFYFHVLPFCQGQQPIIEWAKGLSKVVGTQGKEPDPHKVQKMFAWCFTKWVPRVLKLSLWPRHQNRESTMFTPPFTGVWPYSSSL